MKVEFETMPTAISNKFRDLLRLLGCPTNKMNKSDKIPTKIHQLWIPPPHLSNLPDDILPQTSAWREFHPDFEHRIWTLEQAAESLSPSRAARMMGAVNVSRFEAMKADIVRLYLLAEHGGFWSDLKVRPRRRWLNDYLKDDLLMVEHFKWHHVQETDGVLINNFIGARPGNYFIEACIERAHFNIDARKQTSIYDITGPKMLMDVYSNLTKTNSPFRCSILKSDFAWGVNLELGSGSYSSGNAHWSIREKTESAYLY